MPRTASAGPELPVCGRRVRVAPLVPVLACVVSADAGAVCALVATGVGFRGALVGFVLFRVLDVVKPWPARRLERLHGGTGIMADDVMAAIYANILLQVAVRTTPWNL